MKRFFNTRETIVTDALDGTILAAGVGRLARLDGYPNIKVIVRRDWVKDKVAIVSGGGSGHEPAHPGFVGRGMLTAAVAGEIFASPSVDAVLAAILAVSGPAGCLLIVKNYTGDRLNFGLAAERAKQLGIKVEVVIVADDIALPDAPQPRGVAGTLFVHKIAGHLAETGRSLEEVAAGAGRAAAALYSFGVSLSTCTIPGLPSERRQDENEMELGLGIHGEPGVERQSIRPVREIIAVMVDRLLRRLPSDNDSRYGLLVNNLGSVPALEMSIIVNEILSSPLAPKIELLFGPAWAMTSLDMNGFSLSLIALDAARREALESPVEAPAWPAGVRIGPLELLPLPELNAQAAPRPSQNPPNHARVKGVAEALISLEAELNALDAKVGDGDTGSTMASAARSVLAKLDQLPLASDGAMCVSIGELLSRSMGGSSGVLLSIFFTAMGQALNEDHPWPEALARGVERMKFYGGACAGDRTMLDALLPAVDVLNRGGTLAAAASAAKQGADATAKMQRARAGRSAYVPSSNLGGVQDPGAAAVAAVFAKLVEIKLG